MCVCNLECMSTEGNTITARNNILTSRKKSVNQLNELFMSFSSLAPMWSTGNVVHVGVFINQNFRTMHS